MNHQDKYRGIIPALYACYDDRGEISPERTRAFVRYLASKGVRGLYVGGSSGECIYQSVQERKITLENVMAVRGDLTVIAHVACNNTRDSIELARHAESLGVDAIASIPPIYFHLPEHAIAEYWNAISAAAPNTDFVIYNIPQLSGTSLTMNLFREMRKNPRVIAVKNSSDPVQDIRKFKTAGGSDCIVFNGGDEQFVAGRLMGADGGIGGTYAVMPELFLQADRFLLRGEFEKARDLQEDIDEIIYASCGGHGNMYAILKELLRRNGMNIGGVRPPLTAFSPEDGPLADRCDRLIKAAIRKYVC
jgi:N-acetylneuraminate lyase